MRAPRWPDSGIVLATLLAVVVSAAPAGAQVGASDARRLWVSVLPDAASWIAQPGGPAWNPEAGLGLGSPISVAGHAWRGWTLVDPERAPEGGPFPGLPATPPPLAGYDSIEVRPSAPPSPSGPQGALSRVTPRNPLEGAAGRPLATFAVTSGDFGLDETSLSADRKGETSRIGVETMSAHLGEVGSYGGNGRHRWGVSLGQRFGAHDVSATFRQAGLAARLAGGEEETARGGSGSLAWVRDTPERRLHLEASRQWDSHEGFGATLGLPSRRDAQELRVEGGVRARTVSRSFGARLEWRRAEVRRSAPTIWEDDEDDAWLWLDARDESGPRRVSLEIGTGYFAATEHADVAPAARIAWIGTGRRDEVWTQRLLEPVGHDLRAGEVPFLQNTWIVGAATERTRGWGTGALTVIGGRTRDRALLVSAPLEEQWLQSGVRRDPRPWNFGQVLAETRLERGPWRIGGQACGLIRDEGAGVARQARQDPALTSRLFGEAHFSAFGGDLGLRARIEGDFVGERSLMLAETDAGPTRLASTWSTNASVTEIIADAWITLRANHLEGGEHLLPWRDSRTGEAARGLPREIRLAVAWRLRN